MDASAYRQYKNSSLFVRYVEKPWVLKEVGPIEGKIVCDLGCGGGFYTRELAKRDPLKLVGIDPSPSMIKEAQLSTRDLYLTPEFHLGTHIALRNFSSYFDVVMTNFLLPFTRDEAELEEVCRVIYTSLVPGGKVVGFIPNIPVGSSSNLKKYGFSCTVAEEVSGVPEGKVVWYNESGEPILRSSFRSYSIQTLYRAFHRADFSSIRFLRPTIDQEGILTLGEEFWADLIDPPKILMLEVEK